jgi:hypothetical protein
VRGRCWQGTDLEPYDPDDELFRADPRLREAAQARAQASSPPCVFTEVGARPAPAPGAAPGQCT